VWRCPPTPI